MSYLKSIRKNHKTMPLSLGDLLRTMLLYFRTKKTEHLREKGIVQRIQWLMGRTKGLA